jgi:hypothetical protein
MGLKITTQIYTNVGPSSEAYVNIESIEVKKSQGIIVKLNNYLSKELRESDPSSKIVSTKLYDRVFIAVEPESTELAGLEANPIHSFVYSKIKEKLIALELTVEDDI